MSRGNRSRQAGERTAEERERDRLERERRRTMQQDPSPEGPPQQPPDEPSRPSEPLQPSEPPEPLQPPAPEPASEAPAWVVEDAGDAPAAPLQVPEAPFFEESHEQDVPRGHPARSRPGVRRRGGGRSGRPQVTRARVAALLALALAIALVWFLVSLFQPFAGSGSGRVIVVIPKGASSSKIGSILEREGVVASGFFFEVRAFVEGKRSSLHSGRFVLQHDMSYAAAISALSKPPPRVIAVKVVIPEGYTRRQIGKLVGEDALSGDYLAASRSSALLRPSHYGAPAGTDDLEGFLFPATYVLSAGAPAQRLVDQQLQAFKLHFARGDERRARALGLTPYQLLIVASMVEREAQTEHDRPLVAAVIYNRLRLNMPLGIDATILYAVEQRLGVATYTGELTQSELEIDSPYNTRTHKGLPPTPIANPGEAAIEAAAHPAHVSYLYYVAGADGCGEQVFSKTYAEFQKNAAAYQAAVRKNGGKPPTCKKK